MLRHLEPTHRMNAAFLPFPMSPPPFFPQGRIPIPSSHPPGTSPHPNRLSSAASNSRETVATTTAFPFTLRVLLAEKVNCAYGQTLTHSRTPAPGWNGMSRVPT
jgi:hypothetical protein